MSTALLGVYQNLQYMRVKPLRQDLRDYQTKHGLNKKFAKQLTFFISNPSHPSLHTEILEPKHLKLYSFRIDRKYRAIFIFTALDEAEVIDINPHYQ